MAKAFEDSEDRSDRLPSFQMPDELRRVRLVMEIVALLALGLMISKVTSTDQSVDLSYLKLSIDSSFLYAFVHVVLSYTILHFLFLFLLELRAGNLYRRTPSYFALLDETRKNLELALESLDRSLRKTISLFEDIGSYKKVAAETLEKLRDILGTITQQMPDQLREPSVSSYTRVMENASRAVEVLNHANEVVVTNLSRFPTNVSEVQISLRSLLSSAEALSESGRRVMRRRAFFEKVAFFGLDIIVPAAFAILVCICLLGKYPVRATFGHLLPALYEPLLAKMSSILWSRS